MGRKFEQYRDISSLREYLLVAQERIQVTQCVREGETWVLTAASDPEGVIHLPSVNCRLSLQEVYRRVVFP